MVTSVKVRVGVKSQKSVAVAVPVLAGSVLAVQAMVIFTGQEIKGGVLSVRVIIWTHMLIFPLSSTAIQVRLILYPKAQPEVAMVTSL